MFGKSNLTLEGYFIQYALVHHSRMIFIDKFLRHKILFEEENRKFDH